MHCLGQGWIEQAVVPDRRLASGAAGLQLVWRAYVFKYLLSERSGENHARDYWSTFTLRADGSLSCCGGATRSYPHGPGPKESLPWCSA